MLFFLKCAKISHVVFRIFEREENEFKAKKSTFGTDEIDHKTAVSLTLTVQ